MDFICFFDFDSTLCAKESLDELLCYSLGRRGVLTDELSRRIENVTDAGMDGSLPLKRTLELRLSLARPSRQDVHFVAEVMSQQLTPGIDSLLRRLQAKGHETYILSGGFTELIAPSAAKLGIATERVFANRFVFEGERIVGFDPQNIACQPQAKSTLIAQICASGDKNGTTIMIGDGITDLETEHCANYFIGFGMHRCRPIVRERSRFFATDTDQLEMIFRNIGVL